METDACPVSITTSMAAGSSSSPSSATGSGAAPEDAPLPPFFLLGDRLLNLVYHALIVLRGAVRLDEADHAVDLLGGDEAALHAAGLPSPSGA